MLYALSSMYGPQLVADAFVQICQVSPATGRQLLLPGIPYTHAQGVFSSVDRNPAIDRQLPDMKTSPADTQPCLQEAAAPGCRKQAGKIMLHYEAHEEVLHACSKRGLSRASGMLRCQQVGVCSWELSMLHEQTTLL